MVIKDLYFTISEAAKELGVSRQTIYRWINDKKIPTEKIGGIVLIEKIKIQERKTQSERESFTQLVGNYMTEEFKKQFLTKDTDDIEVLPDEEGFLVFKITNKDGTQKKISIGGALVKVYIGRDENAPFIRGVELSDIKDEPLKRPKVRKRKGKKNNEE